MLHPHSLLWHYLWIGPHVLQLLLVALIWRRGLLTLSPVFFAYLIYEGTEEITLYLMDVLPSVGNVAWWRACFGGMAIEGLLKLVVIWEVCRHLTQYRPAAAKSGDRLFAFTVTVLVALAAFAATRAPIDIKFPLISGVHILAETVYILVCGLWLFTFVFAARAHLSWSKHDFGIALGAGISSCVHLATFGLTANTGPFAKAYLLDFVNMSIYHICVLIWFFYLLSPGHTGPVPTDHGTSTERKTDASVRRTGQRLEPTRLMARFQK